jgi:hypothetical protein
VHRCSLLLLLLMLLLLLPCLLYWWSLLLLLPLLVPCLVHQQSLLLLPRLLPCPVHQWILLLLLLPTAAALPVAPTGDSNAAACMNIVPQRLHWGILKVLPWPAAHWAAAVFSCLQLLWPSLGRRVAELLSSCTCCDVCLQPCLLPTVIVAEAILLVAVTPESTSGRWAPHAQYKGIRSSDCFSISKLAAVEGRNTAFQQWMWSGRHYWQQSLHWCYPRMRKQCSFPKPCWY